MVSNALIQAQYEQPATVAQQFGQQAAQQATPRQRVRNGVEALKAVA